MNGLFPKQSRAPVKFCRWHADSVSYCKGLCAQCYNAQNVHGVKAAEARAIQQLCDSCQKPFQSGKDKHVDHDHTIKNKAKAFRGILCSKCNVALGMLRDDVDTILRLAQYADKHRVKPIA